MARIKYKENSPLLSGWAENVGKLILNFSAIELESYQWLVQMSEELKSIHKFIKKSFSFRVFEIEKYIEERSFTEQWKISAVQKWNAVRELSLLRNRVAHNPIFFSWSDSEQRGEPDYLGVIDMKKREQNKQGEDELLSKSRIQMASNEIADLVAGLERLRKEWCSIRDQGS